MRAKRLFALLAGVVLALAIAGGAWAYFTVSVDTGGSGASKAASVNAGNTPTASVTGTRQITVSWTASTLTNSQPVSGYIVKRYDADTDSLQSTGSACSGTINGTSCVESNVPNGRWKYTVTPKIATNWQGAESSKSSSVSVVGGAGLTLDKSVLGAPLPKTATGALTGFLKNETITAYRLDGSSSSTGTALSGSPSTANASGNASVSVTIPAGTSEGSHTINIYGGNGSHSSAGIFVDLTNPTISASQSPAANGAGWNNTSPVSVTLTGADTGGSGVSEIHYTIDGSTPTSSSATYTNGSPISIASTTTIKFIAIDAGGNQSDVGTQQVNIDTTAPTNSLALSSVSPAGTAVLNNGTVYYKGSVAGSFALTNTVADTGGSGPASSSTSAFSGTSTGWTHTPSTVSTPSGGPYVSNSFSWAAGTTSSPSTIVTGADVAGNTAPAALSFVNDNAGPTGGGITATPDGSVNLVLTLSKGTDPVGLASTGATLLRSSSNANITNANCGTMSGFTLVTTDPSSPYTDSGLTTARCYQYQYVVSDTFGNQTTYTSPVFYIDTSAPTGTGLTLANANGNTFVSGTTAFINAQAGKSGSFDVTTAPTDGQSGILKVNFPVLAGFTSGGGDDNTSPYSTTYSWSGAVAASGSQTVTNYNNGGKTATASFTVTPDATAPTGVSLTPVGLGGVDGDGSTSLTISLNGQTGADTGGSGVATPTLTRSSAPLNPDDSCGTYGSSAAVSYLGNNARNYTVPPGPACYRFELTSTDNVGNATVVNSGDVKVDTSAPAAPPLTLSSATGNTFINAGTKTVYVNAQAGRSGTFQVAAAPSDSDSGIWKVTFPTVGTGFTGGGDVLSSLYQTTYSWSGASNPGATQNVTATNNVGGTSANSAFTITKDTTAPGSGSLAVSGTTNAIGTTSFSKTGTFSISRTDFTDSGSGLASSTLVRTQATFNSDGSCNSFGNPTTVPGAVSETTLDEGCYLYTLTGTDNVGNVASASATVKVDKTAPALANTNPILLANGGTGGKLDNKDTITIAFREQMDATKFCSGWTNSASNSTTVNVSVNNVAGSDTVTAPNPVAGCTGGFHTGTVNLNADYMSATDTSVSTTITMDSSSTGPSTLVIKFTATPAGANAGPVAASIPTWNADSTLADLAGNLLGTGPFTGTSSGF